MSFQVDASEMPCVSKPLKESKIVISLSLAIVTVSFLSNFVLLRGQ